MYRKYITNLNNWIKKTEKKPLLMLGARQVGKTYLIEQFAQQSGVRFHMFDFEKQTNLHSLFDRSLEPAEIIRGIELLFDINIGANDLLIFDEIQACPRALTSLKYFYQDTPNRSLIAAGSLLGLYFSESSFPVGKVELLDIYPMNFFEFLLAIGETKLHEYLSELTVRSEIPDSIHSKAWNIFKEYLVVGGLPDVVLLYSQKRKDTSQNLLFKEVRKNQEMLYRMYLADMAKHCGKQNAMHLQRVWHAAATQLGQNIDGSADKFKFGGVIPEIKNYGRLAGSIDWIIQAGLCVKTPIAMLAKAPLAAYTKENFFKLYLLDVGLLGSMINLFPNTIMDYDFGTYKGFFIENFVANELVAIGYKNLYGWRENTAEIEFLINHPQGFVPIEVKSGHKTRSKSLAAYSEKYHPPKKVVASANILRENEESGVLYLPIYLLPRLFDFIELS